MLPGIERQPRKKREPNPERLLALLHRWQDEAVSAARVVDKPDMRLSGTRIEVHNYPHADQVRQASRLELLDDVGAV